MVDNWGEVGFQHTWDALQGLVPNQHCKVVVQLACVEPLNGFALGVLYPNNCQVRIHGLTEVREATQAVTLIDAVYLGINMIPSFQVTPHTLVAQHGPIRAFGLHNVVELCAGIGIATTGLDFVGFTTKLAVELKAPFASVFADLHPQSQVIVGDINNQQSLRQIVQQAPEACILFAGFNCQPYSRAGLQKGIHDPRAASLHGVLQVAFYLRCPVILLECVVEAASNRHVQDELTTFASQCGYHISHVVLKLEDVWPCRRERWWVVLSAMALGKIGLRPLPSHSFPTSVKQIIPRPLRISPSDLEQLQIVGQEFETFTRHRPDLQSMMVPLQGKCPTLLHSLGSQATKCLCGCRDQGFADSTLAKGLFGIVMPVEQQVKGFEQDLPCIRHPHPNEAAMLSAVAPRPDWHCHHRLALAGIGQQANPIHALWIAAQVKVHLESLLEGKVTCSPRALLDDYIDRILKDCKSASLVQIASDSEPQVEDVAVVIDVEMDETPPLCNSVESNQESLALPRTHLGDEHCCTVVELSTQCAHAVRVAKETTVGDLLQKPLFKMRESFSKFLTLKPSLFLIHRMSYKGDVFGLGHSKYP